MMGNADSVVRYFKYSLQPQQYFKECIDVKFKTTNTKRKVYKTKRTTYVEHNGLKDMILLLLLWTSSNFSGMLR